MPAPPSALILAAGRGQRLGALTAERPKCLVELAGRTLLDWQLSALARAGIADVTVVTGYRGEAIRARGLRTVHNARWEQTNMAASLFHALGEVEAPAWLVLYGDVVYHPAIPLALAQAEHEAALSYDTLWLELWRRRFDDPSIDAETFRLEGARVVEIGGKVADLGAVQGQYMGLMRFSAEALEKLAWVWGRLAPDQQDRIDMTALLARAIEQGMEIAGIPAAGRWCEVDNARDLALYESLATNGPGRWSHDWRWDGQVR
jgi:L-glutamine-phosphate cytidylyltransferase